VSKLPVFTRTADLEIADLNKRIAELEKVISLDVKLKELAVKKRITGNKKQWEESK
jgi:hypothetical protein